MTSGSRDSYLFPPMDWLYSTSETQTTETDAAGNPYTTDTWEARVLGQVVYKVTTQGGLAPAGDKPKPATLADGVATESHWLDVDRTADSRAETPEPGLGPGRTVTNVGVLGFNVWGSGNGGKERDKESHWLDVDRIADSRAESPVLGEASPAIPTNSTSGPATAKTTKTTTLMSPAKKRELVGSPLAKGG
ncbi:hypothetical protein CcaverHIS002_0200650 [Cutaneotrichosporon cavernicola]|uniref:Uncharacterized protein n=1 Tax=Cutaneotrichosporon cavernicola TaxID=279322 RepID=A0AA48IEV4_9TREE|nr:uncharacterized protein CcaverHIS019_0200700 [Cutaneotrichosporon cavernicola]BEI80905.1 hypothetical protein CcaverHIS002_0200650 [Cutaneotrichosporon cavernicola]BEI88708.1 hypothetical protein CcaverHIS019_0200700 [Cutaneotrichosporon cavernicola]BEI96482.1 hypothetical protein CcaverHIS631_0200710 [Cutaneotrichosporon cavernicola]BEJ04253.1 hypothetical protein CcaverHIS641_0200700 [Cutaneotrichosporon cavernicola]